MLSRLTLPPPHRLVRGTPSRWPAAAAAAAAAGVVEETDSAPPAGKRRNTLGTSKPAKIGSESKGQTPPIVQTFSGKPLEKFSLYLPQCLPASIATDAPALSSYVLSSAATYLTLWNLDKNMESVDIRLPEEYSNHLKTHSECLSRFLKVVFNTLEGSGVKSIGKFVAPTLSLSDVTVVLNHLAGLTITVKEMYVPLSTSASLSSSASADISEAVSTLTAHPAEITFISPSPDLPKILKEIKRVCRKQSSIKFSSLSSEDTSSSDILADLGAAEAEGQLVSPEALITSINARTSHTGGESEDSEKLLSGESLRRSARPKQVLRRAFATDCSYTEDPQLSTDNTYPSKLWNLERLHDSGIDGTGTTMAVLDSGINYTSPAFKDRIVAVRNFVPDSIDDFDCAIDSDGHGSLCAGIAAGSSFYCPITQGDPRSPCLRIPPGVAPGAKLIICKVVGTTSGEVDTNAFLEALKWLKELCTSGEKIDVVSISLASSYFSHERARVISDLVNLGVIVVCCASNVGRMKMQPISYPARLGHVICVGSHDDNGKPTSFTPVGRELDVLAPGEDIWGPGPGTKGPFSMDCGSGTSCSTPAVAGLICLVIHDIGRRCCEREEGGVVDVTIAGRPVVDYVRSVWVMRELLKHMSSSPGHHSEEIGHGTLNPYRLLDSNTEEIVRIINDIIEDED